MKYIIPELNTFRKDSIKLDWNEGSRKILKSLDFVDLDRLKNYPIFESYLLKNSILEKFNFNNNIDITLTSGSDEFNFRLLLYLKNKINCLYFINPSYTQIKTDCSLLDINVNNLNADPFKDYSIDLFKNIKKNEKAVFYFCNPNNPTGRNLKKSFLIEMIENFKNSIFIIDEAYIDFCESLSLVDLINRYDNLIFVRTFSKAFSLASLRVGYGIYDKTKFSELNNYFNPKSISLLSTVICKKVLESNLIDSYLDDVSKFKEVLKSLNNPRIVCNYGNFFLYKAKLSVKEYINKLENNKIYVRDRSFLYGLEGYVRISISDYDIMIKNLDTLIEKE